MKFIGGISILCLFGLCFMHGADAAEVTPQIQNLLRQKQEKIEALEQCDGKRKGFMIAGISTLGLTAVGVGVNVVQAKKSSNLSSQIDATKAELSKQESRLSDINFKIRQKNDSSQTNIVPQQEPNQRSQQTPQKTNGLPRYCAGYVLDCAHTKFTFFSFDPDCEEAQTRIQVACTEKTGEEGLLLITEESGNLTQKDPTTNTVTRTETYTTLECKKYASLPECQGVSQVKPVSVTDFISGVESKATESNCVNTGGTWNDGKCSCSATKGLELFNNICRCTDPNLSWCPNTHMCIPPAKITVTVK